jgi:hypothetical protein
MAKQQAAQQTNEQTEQDTPMFRGKPLDSNPRSTYGASEAYKKAWHEAFGKSESEEDVAGGESGEKASEAPVVSTPESDAASASTGGSTTTPTTTGTSAR